MPSAPNPIVQFPLDGNFQVWGKKPIKPTPLNRVSVRRMLLYCQKQFTRILRNKPWRTDEWLEDEFHSLLVDLGMRGAFYDYQLVVDKTGALIGILPTPYSEWIEVEMTCSTLA